MTAIRTAEPDQVTLVPDDPDQRTSDHGWNLAADGERHKGQQQAHVLHAPDYPVM